MVPKALAVLDAPAGAGAPDLLDALRRSAGSGRSARVDAPPAAVPVAAEAPALAPPAVRPQDPGSVTHAGTGTTDDTGTADASGNVDETGASDDAVTRSILAERPFLDRLALRLSRRRADADDLVQETFLRAYRARDRFRRGTSMRAWLATILRRLFLTQLATRKRRGTHTDTDSGDLLARRRADDGYLAPTPTRARLVEQIDDRLVRAVRSVPEPYREPFELFALDGLAYGDIAHRLGIPVGTVMSRIHRARSRIRERLAGPTRPARSA